MTLSDAGPNTSRRTILVTDSGLGGMSVFAQIAADLKKKSPWPDVRLIYFNAWPEQTRGYNHFKTMDHKARVFDNALTAMENFNPDKILIACNTLSVIYPFTPYSRETKIQVSGIVDYGVQLIYENLVPDPDTHVIIFGTPTTIDENSHKKNLVKMGINSDRITCQGCTDLAGKIEKNPFQESIEQLINTHVMKAVSKMDISAEKIYAALCCTHFGYREDLFQKALFRHTGKKVTLLNPNQRMADHAVKNHTIAGITADIDIKVISRVFWEPERIDAYAKLLTPVSPDVVKALTAYKWDPDLFKT